MSAERDAAAQRLVELHEERCALAAELAASPQPNLVMVNAVLGKGEQLERDAEAFRRRFYPRRHRVVAAFGQVLVASRTLQHIDVVYAARERVTA